MNVIPPGVYRHFKGGRYQVLFVARHSETDEAMVVYQPLYGQGGHWVRPLAMWQERVEHQGKMVCRFALEEAENAGAD